MNNVQSIIRHDLMQEAIDTWGTESQIDLCQEECSELITALAHYRRGRTDSYQKAVEEIADVAIMVYQMQILFGANAVSAMIEQKMNRLDIRLKEHRFEDSVSDNSEQTK